MKNVKITINSPNLIISSHSLCHIIQIMEFLGHTHFTRIMEEYQNFCRNAHTKFIFSVGVFCITYESGV